MLISAPETKVRFESISELLDKLTKYASIHFLAEEQLLEEFGYPGRALQREMHKAYRIKIAALFQAAFFHKDSLPTELLLFFRDWWAKHILEIDRKYRYYVTTNAVN